MWFKIEIKKQDDTKEIIYKDSEDMSSAIIEVRSEYPDCKEIKIASSLPPST